MSESIENSQKPGSTSVVVAVAVREDDKIEPGQVDGKGLYVRSKNLESAAGVKEYASAAVLNEGRITPAVLECRGLAEGIVEDRHTRW